MNKYNKSVLHESKIYAHSFFCCCKFSAIILGCTFCFRHSGLVHWAKHIQCVVSAHILLSSFRWEAQAVDYEMASLSIPYQTNHILLCIYINSESVSVMFNIRCSKRCWIRCIRIPNTLALAERGSENEGQREKVCKSFVGFQQCSFRNIHDHSQRAKNVHDFGIEFLLYWNWSHENWTTTSVDASDRKREKRRQKTKLYWLHLILFIIPKRPPWRCIGNDSHVNRMRFAFCSITNTHIYTNKPFIFGPVCATMYTMYFVWHHKSKSMLLHVDVGCCCFFVLSSFSSSVLLWM